MVARVASQASPSLTLPLLPSPARGPPPPPKDEPPPWHNATGMRRIQMEFQHLARALAAPSPKGTLPLCADLELPDESDLRTWRFKLRDFDPDLPGGAALNADLARLKREHGCDHLLCEANFPPDYPSRPFLLRLVYPRCCWYTGHVTAGGSICVEALTQTGSANAWRPDYCLSGLLPLVKQNLVDVDEVMVRTASGPGGRAGPLRIDFARQWHTSARTPLVPYSLQEAQAAFSRSEAHHRANGW